MNPKIEKIDAFFIFKEEWNLDEHEYNALYSQSIF